MSFLGQSIPSTESWAWWDVCFFLLDFLVPWLLPWLHRIIHKLLKMADRLSVHLFYSQRWLILLIWNQLMSDKLEWTRGTVDIRYTGIGTANVYVSVFMQNWLTITMVTSIQPCKEEGLYQKRLYPTAELYYLIIMLWRAKVHTILYFYQIAGKP